MFLRNFILYKIYYAVYSIHLSHSILKFQNHLTFEKQSNFHKEITINNNK